jgi:hypothetical protein
MFRWENQKRRDHHEENIKMDLREIGWGSMDWILRAEDGDLRPLL